MAVKVFSSFVVLGALAIGVTSTKEEPFFKAATTFVIKKKKKPTMLKGAATSVCQAGSQYFKTLSQG